MRRAARVDANQQAVVEGLRKAGASVAITSALGDGFPDLVVGYHGRTVLMELKDGRAKTHSRYLTGAEVAFHFHWRGAPCVVVESLEQAMECLVSDAVCRHYSWARHCDRVGQAIGEDRP